MIEIAPTSKAKDVGAKADGEDWQEKTNLIVFKATTDFIITAQNTVADWNQDIRVGKTGEQWMTVDVAYTNTVVGNLTDKDFPVPEGCTSTCVMTEKEQEMWEAGLGWGPEESEVAFGDTCTKSNLPNPVWGTTCRMQELCGTGCEAGECKWNWAEGDQDNATCGCAKCKAEDFFLQ